MIHHVRENELFDQPKHGQVFMAPDLIQSPLFVRDEKRKLLYLSQGLGHEGLREIEPLLASDNVFHSPADPLGGFESSLVTVPILHGQSSFCCLQLVAACNEEWQKTCQDRIAASYFEKTTS